MQCWRIFESVLDVWFWSCILFERVGEVCDVSLLVYLQSLESKLKNLNWLLGLVCWALVLVLVGLYERHDERAWLFFRRRVYIYTKRERIIISFMIFQIASSCVCDDDYYAYNPFFSLHHPYHGKKKHYYHLLILKIRRVPRRIIRKTKRYNFL